MGMTVIRAASPAGLTLTGETNATSLSARMRFASLSRVAFCDGLAKTARVITAAAAIMVVVFLAFVASPEVFLKLFGIGLAAAIFLDATLVRMVLVPAVMQLLGARAWWIPGWLDRILPRLHVEPDEGDPSPTGEHPVVAAVESDR